MNRNLLRAALLLFVFSAGALSAFDWGVTLDNSSTLEFGEWPAGDTEVQRIKVSLWGEHFWSGSDSSQYKLLFNFYYLYTDERAFLIDTDLLAFQMSRPNLFGGGSVLNLSAGRFRFSDTTATVLNHGADGVLAGLDLRAVQVSAGAGYTGLQLKPETGIEMSAADVADSDDDDVRFAPKRLFEILTLRFPEILPRQRLSLEALLQQDLRTGGGDTLDSAHASVRLDGALGGGVYYDVSGSSGWNLSDEVQDFFTQGSILWFSESFFGSRAAIGLLYAGEDFFTVSTPTLGLVYTPDPADLLRLSFDYSLRPWNDRFSPSLRNLQFLAAGRLYFISDGTYTGAELEGGINFRPASDFGASVKAGVWMPDGGDLQGLVRLEVSVGL